LVVMQTPRPDDAPATAGPTMRALQQQLEKKRANPDHMYTPEEMQEAGREMIAEQARHDAAIETAVGRFTGAGPTRRVSALFAVAICFVPIVILVMTLLDHLGGVSTILFRDYMSLLVCCLMAWTAAYLPALVVSLALAGAHLTGPAALAVFWAANAYFVIL